ncbi:MAG: peptidylprolyl isomerase [Candidatus Cloacimonadaceae bacterium]|nr:peptidylprolyl isomerase [Candidatus Cloacimonadaceae bacterium]
MKRIIPALLIILMALLTACSVNQGRLAGKVNGTPIPYDEFIAANRGHYENFWMLNNRAPGIDEKQEIMRQTWRNITKHVILKDNFKKYGIRVSPQEMIDTLKTNIPPYLKTSPRFMVNGVFDYNIYLQSLLYDTPENLLPVRKHYFDYLIPILKLKNELIDRKMLTKKESKRITQVLAGKADIDWVIVDATNIQPIISESEITQYYQKNLDQYRMDESFALAYILLPVRPSAEDMIYAAAVTDSIFTELRSGEPAQSVIARHKVHYPGIILKNSGFLRNADLDPKLYAMFSAMKESDYSPPVEDSGSFTIYHLEQLTKSMTSFNTITIVASPLAASVKRSRSAAERLYQLAQTVGMENAANEMSLSYVPIKNLNPESVWIGDSAILETIFKELHDKKRGHIFTPIYSNQLFAWVVVQMTDNQLNRVRPLSSVQNDIVAVLRQSKSIEIAKVTASEWLRNQTAGIINLAALPHSSKESVPSMSFTTPLGDIKVGMIYYDAIRRYLDKSATQVYVAGTTILIPFVKNHRIDKNAVVSPVQLRETYKRTLNEDWFDLWVEDQIRCANVSIFVNM